MAKKNKRPEPRIVRPDDIDPKHLWDRPLQAPGHTQVDALDASGARCGPACALFRGATLRSQ